MLFVIRVWIFCNLQYQLTMISDFDFLDVDIHQTIWFEQKFLTMHLVIQILYFVICNIFQKDWFLIIYDTFLDVDRHQLKKQVFGGKYFSCFPCCCFIIIFLLYPLIFIFVSYFFFHSFSVLISKIFHYLYLYFSTCLVINFSQFRSFFLCIFWWYWALSKESMDLWNM